VIKPKIKLSLLFLSLLLLCTNVSAEELNKDIGRQYAEKLVTADYAGAIELAQEHYKQSGMNWEAVYSLGRAYLLNYEPSKANKVIEEYMKVAVEPKPIGAYFAYASVNCEAGKYEKAYEIYRAAEKAYPDQLMRINTPRLLCKMKQIETERNQDSKKKESFKNEIKEHFQATKNLKTDSPRTKAMLAREVLHDNTLARDYASDELVLATLVAKDRFGDESLISASTRGFVALFWALAGDVKQAKPLLICGKDCGANFLTLNGNDLLYLSRCFAVFGDIPSSDKALRALWERMKTDEQKREFFKYVIEKVDKESPWAKAGETDWIRKEYSNFLAASH
jgi:tetratricopeptide (TPR) repeat protein